MIRRAVVLSLTLVLTGIIAVVGYVALRGSWETVTFDDPGLEQAVRDTINVSEGDLLASQVARISTLEGAYYDIVSLEGIDALRNVRVLNLEGNRINDLAPLVSLEKLEVLILRDNAIINLEDANVEALFDLPLLRELNLRHNVQTPDPTNPSVRIRLTDISLLAEMTNLETLIVRDNLITDLAPLGSLSKLRQLDISLNPIQDRTLSDLAPLTQLKHLNIRQTGINDIAVVAGFTQLEYLNIHSNIDLIDLAPIASLVELRTLIMRNVPMRDNLQHFTHLVNLSRLNIRNTGTTDFTVLANLMSQGALQDNPAQNIFASVDLRDNPVTFDDGAQGYEVLRPYWHNISERQPRYLPGSVLINEFMASNGSTIADGDGDYEDWIELYNPNAFPIDLSGYYLTDDAEDLTQWTFPAGSHIGAGEHKLIFASGKNTTDSLGYLHTNFSIAREGEPLMLVYTDGETVVDAVDATFVPRDMSYGRYPDGTANWEYFDANHTSPGEANHNPGRLPHEFTPEFSHAGGFYTESFFLMLEAEANATIYYTLDGSTPTTDSDVYDGAITITHQMIDPPTEGDIIIIQRGVEPADPRPPLSRIKTTSYLTRWNLPAEPYFKATTVRAMAVDDAGNQSRVVTHTYFVDDDMPTRYTFPILSIVTDMEHLFDYETGIYVPGANYDDSIDEADDNRTGNYFERGPEWERPVHLEYYSHQGDLLFSQNAGMRVHGGLSRKYAFKSYRFYARYDYDDVNAFNVPFFDDKDMNSFRRILLRNGGQAYNRTFFGEAAMHDIFRPLPLDGQHNQPVIVFINGEYFGIRNIRDRVDRFYFEAHHGVNPDNVTILDGNGRLDDGSSEGIAHYRYSRDYVLDNNMAINAHYDYASTLIDMENLATYYAMQLYVINTDWPQNNVRYWRLNTDRFYPDAPYGHDGRWRWLVNDLDASFGVSFGGVDPSMESFERMTGDDFRTGELFVSLLANESFRTYFINVFADMTNTVFNPERVHDILDGYVSLYEVEMPEHIARYGYPSSMSLWRSRVNRMYDFASGRPDYARAQLIDYFNLDGAFTLTLKTDLERGSLKVNTVWFNSDSEYLPAADTWEGMYYNHVPVTLVAQPKEGYVFSHWEDGSGTVLSEDSTFVLNTEHDTEVVAVFVTP